MSNRSLDWGEGKDMHEMLPGHEDLRLLLQALLAILLGGAIGWERESAGKWAGLRTHMLVCLACVMFINVGLFLAMHSHETLHEDVLQMDSVRLVEAIVTGIAFIGAGTVFRDRNGNRMRGLTTAASLFTVAPIGIAIAIERYVAAIGFTVIVLIVLRLVGWLEVRANLKRHANTPKT